MPPPSEHSVFSEMECRADVARQFILGPSHHFEQQLAALPIRGGLAGGFTLYVPRTIPREGSA